ncbi:MAG: methyltransferase type 11 [Modestobacter sp.]|jgi:SAM-dependent methyltransferase|nr:methyltransferase type 11 [Modestobacter sp.]
MDEDRELPVDAAVQPFNAGFDEFPEAYDELRAAGHMARRRADFFTDVIDRFPGVVLEIGCGTGTLLRNLAARRPDRQFIGIEPLPNYVDFARSKAAAAGRGNVQFEAATGETLSAVVEPDSIGLVISVDALHHVTDSGEVVREVARAATSGAHWWAMEPNRVHPYVWAYHVFTTGERTFPARDFIRRARAAGWDLVSRQNMYLYPSGIAQVPGWAERLELRWERHRPVAGAVVLDLRLR